MRTTPGTTGLDHPRGAVVLGGGLRGASHCGASAVAETRGVRGGGRWRGRRDVRHDMTVRRRAAATEHMHVVLRGLHQGARGGIHKSIRGCKLARLCKQGNHYHRHRQLLVYAISELLCTCPPIWGRNSELRFYCQFVNIPGCGYSTSANATIEFHTVRSRRFRSQRRDESRLHTPIHRAEIHIRTPNLKLLKYCRRIHEPKHSTETGGEDQKTCSSKLRNSIHKVWELNPITPYTMAKPRMRAPIQRTEIDIPKPNPT